MQNLFSSRFIFKINIYGNKILPVLLCVCETLSLKLREEGRQSLFEKSVLSVIFGPMKDDETE
jgi:hypothetical protein